MSPNIEKTKIETEPKKIKYLGIWLEKIFIFQKISKKEIKYSINIYIFLKIQNFQSV